MEYGFLIIGCTALLLAVVCLVFDALEDFLEAILPISFGDDVGITRFMNTGAFLGFVAGFGFIGAIVMNQTGHGALVAACFGAIGGGALGSIMGALWYALKKSEGGVGYKMQDLVGQKGVVSEEILKVGRVECSINGKSVWNTAQSINSSSIPVGTPIEVVGVVGSILQVKPSN